MQAFDVSRCEPTFPDTHYQSAGTPPPLMDDPLLSSTLPFPFFLSDLSLSLTLPYDCFKLVTQRLRKLILRKILCTYTAYDSHYNGQPHCSPFRLTHVLLLYNSCNFFLCPTPRGPRLCFYPCHMFTNLY